MSHSCDHPPEVRAKPRLTRPRLAIEGRSSGEIDAAVRRAVRELGSVYEVDAALLAALQPDLVLAQGVCEVCAVPVHDAQRAAALVASGAAVVALDTHDVTSVLETVRTVGRMSGVPERAEAFMRGLERRLAAARKQVAGRPRPRVLALEWLDPPYVPGHWIPELIELAGGELVLGAPGRSSYAVEWSDLAGVDPDVLIVMPCGYGLAAAATEATAHAERLRAVGRRAIRSGLAYVVDASSYFSRPGPRVVQGLELLVALLHSGPLAPWGAAGWATRAQRWS